MLVFLAAALLTPPVPFPWGDSGAHLAIIPAALGVWAGILRPRSWQLRLDPLSCAMALLFGSLLLSIPMAMLHSGMEIAAQSSARLGLLAVAIYLYFYLAQGPGRDLDARTLLRWVFWLCFVSCGFALVDFAFQFPAPARFAPQYVWLSSGVYRRAQGVFYEASTLGTLCAFHLVLIAAITARGTRQWLGLSRIALGAGALVALAGLLASLSRAAVITVAAAIIAIMVLDRLSRIAVWSAVFAAAALAIVTFAAPEFADSYLARIRATGEFLFVEPNLVLSRRLESWSVLLNHIGEHPLQTAIGIGYKTLPYTEHLGAPVVADNMYLSLLVETGVPGLLSVLALNTAVLWVSLRQARSPDRVRGLAGTCMFAFWSGLSIQMASGDILTYWRILPVFLVVMALGTRHECSARSDG